MAQQCVIIGIFFLIVVCRAHFLMFQILILSGADSVFSFVGKSQEFILSGNWQPRVLQEADVVCNVFEKFHVGICTKLDYSIFTAS
jgi:hypothetical protein